MPKHLYRRERGPFSQREIAELNEEHASPLDALVIDGRDPTAVHRARARALNDARQQAEAAQRTGHDRRSVAAQAAWNRTTQEQRAEHAHGPRPTSCPPEG